MSSLHVVPRMRTLYQWPLQYYLHPICMVMSSRILISAFLIRATPSLSTVSRKPSCCATVSYVANAIAADVSNGRDHDASHISQDWGGVACYVVSKAILGIHFDVELKGSSLPAGDQICTKKAHKHDAGFAKDLHSIAPEYTQRCKFWIPDNALGFGKCVATYHISHHYLAVVLVQYPRVCTPHMQVCMTLLTHIWYFVRLQVTKLTGRTTSRPRSAASQSTRMNLRMKVMIMVMMT